MRDIGWSSGTRPRVNPLPRRSICTYRGQSHIVEFPTTAGLGISDRQAGILIGAAREVDVA